MHNRAEFTHSELAIPDLMWKSKSFPSTSELTFCIRDDAGREQVASWYNHLAWNRIMRTQVMTSIQSNISSGLTNAVRLSERAIR